MKLKDLLYYPQPLQQSDNTPKSTPSTQNYYEDDSVAENPTEMKLHILNKRQNPWLYSV